MSQPSCTLTTSISGLTASANLVTNDIGSVIVTTYLYWGDGDFIHTVDPGQVYTHTYASYGTYGIYAVVADLNGVWLTSPTQDAIAAPPTPPTCSLTTSVAIRTVTATPTFAATEGTIASACLDWGDGTTTTPLLSGQPYTHTYANTGGTFGVYATATDSLGATGQSTIHTLIIDPNTGPICSFTAVVTPTNDLTVTINANASSEPGGTIVAWKYQASPELAWIAGILGQPAVYTYAQHGTYTIAVQVTDNSQMSSEQQAVVDCENQPPTASYTQLVTQGQVTLQDTSTDSDGQVVSVVCLWDDGTQSVLSPLGSVTRQYTQTGSHTFQYIVTDDDGAISTRTGLVTVVITPTAPVSILPAALTTDQVQTVLYNYYGPPQATDVLLIGTATRGPVGIPLSCASSDAVTTAFSTTLSDVVTLASTDTRTTLRWATTGTVNTFLWDEMTGQFTATPLNNLVVSGNLVSFAPANTAPIPLDASNAADSVILTTSDSTQGIMPGMIGSLTADPQTCYTVIGVAAQGGQVQVTPPLTVAGTNLAWNFQAAPAVWRFDYAPAADRYRLEPQAQFALSQGLATATLLRVNGTHASMLLSTTTGSGLWLASSTGGTMGLEAADVPLVTILSGMRGQPLLNLVSPRWLGYPSLYLNLAQYSTLGAVANAINARCAANQTPFLAYTPDPGAAATFASGTYLFTDGMDGVQAGTAFTVDRATYYEQILDALPMVDLSRFTAIHLPIQD